MSLILAFQVVLTARRKRKKKWTFFMLKGKFIWRKVGERQPLSAPATWFLLQSWAEEASQLGERISSPVVGKMFFNNSITNSAWKNMSCKTDPVGKLGRGFFFSFWAWCQVWEPSAHICKPARGQKGSGAGDITLTPGSHTEVGWT